MNISEGSFDVLLWCMTLLAVIVFISLFFVRAGYGVFRTKQWGIAVNNKIGWVIMEAPVFIVMLWLWWCSEVTCEVVPLIFLLLFECHYFQRSFIFPLLLRGHSKMPVAIVLMGVVFNVVNGVIQGQWLFFLAPKGMYSLSWLTTPQFLLGVIVFIIGMVINLHSDYVIRHLRAPGDTRHYLPSKGLYRYVTSGNYFGEFVEWCGFALATWSWAGAVFALWTFANLAPRAHAIRERYYSEFGREAVGKRKRMIPFIY